VRVALALVREDGRTLSDRCVLADNPASRFRGLMLRRALEPGESLFMATSSIQTTFMRFAIDAVFVDREMRVTRVIERLRPWRIAAHRGASGVVEIAAGTCEREAVEIGERLALVNSADSKLRDQDGSIRVAIATRDRRFHRVASFLLSRNGFVVEEDHDPAGVNELIRRGAIDVLLLDASDSLVTAARTARTFEAVAPEVGLVLAVNADVNAHHHVESLATVPKWGSFDAVVDALERSFAGTRLDGLA
jgi:uncharacterized membrane protein (UPF0127 family)